MPKIIPPDFKYCPMCSHELSSKKEEGRERKFCPQCKWHYFPHPAMASTGVIRRGDQILMVKRAREPYLGTWMFPSGFVEFGEHPDETMIRETKEETGLKVKKVELIKIFVTTDDDREPGALNFFYKVEIEDGELKNDENENLELAWQSIKNPPKIGWESHKEIMKMLQEKLSS